MEIEDENPYGYFEYLKICKRNSGFQLLSEVNVNNIWNAKDLHYYDIMIFKTFICELIYNAINLFPTISEYTIKCKNENGISVLVFKCFEDLAEDGFPCLAKFTSMDMDMIYYLEREGVKSLYMNNRHEHIDCNIVNTIITLMYMGGSPPKVSTTSKINYREFKHYLKFK